MYFKFVHVEKIIPAAIGTNHSKIHANVSKQKAGKIPGLK
jgi:hypothetical protein